MEALFAAQHEFYTTSSFSRWAFPWLIFKAVVQVFVERLLEKLFPSYKGFDRATAEASLQRAGRLASGALLEGFSRKRLSKQGDVGLVECVEVTYGGGKTEKFILKTLGLSFKEAMQSFLMRANLRESFAYTRLAAVAPTVVSKSPFVTYGRAGSGQVLMPDFSHMRQGDNAQGCSAADARLIMLELARLHGSTWANRGGLCAELASFAKDLNVFVADYPNTFATVLSSAPEYFASPKFERYARACCDFKTLAQYNDQGDVSVRKQLVCVIHADARLDNIFLSADKCQLVDWGLLSVSGPGRDIAWFWANDLEPAVLHEHKDALLAAYVAELNAVGGLSVSVKEIEDDVRYYARAVPSWVVVALRHVMHNEQNRPRMLRTLTVRIPGLLDAMGL